MRLMGADGVGTAIAFEVQQLRMRLSQANRKKTAFLLNDAAFLQRQAAHSVATFGISLESNIVF